MKKGALLLLLAFAAVLVPEQATSATTIRPGDRVWTDAGGCTLGFVMDGGGTSTFSAKKKHRIASGTFSAKKKHRIASNKKRRLASRTGSGKTYFLTAAHCVEEVGDDAELDDGRVFADVAAIGNADDTVKDWALLEVRSAFVSSVRAGVRGHPNMPSGVANRSETAFGDLIQHSGYGVPFFVAAPLREERVGVLTDQTDDLWFSVGLDSFGDSGGPVMHRDSAEALGLVSRVCLGACTSEGPTVQGILPQVAAKGFKVSLRTV